MICLDTSVLIDFFRKTQKENSFFYELTASYDNFAVSVITEFEIYSGSNSEQQEFWDQFFANCTILPFDSRAGQIAAKTYQKLKQRNKLIAMPDLLIGATAIANKIKLATLNTKDFERLDELKLITKS